MSEPVTYLTYDGVLDPLGYSQVARVVLALGERGFRYRLVSFERSARLRETARVAEVERRFASAGVEWEAHPYAEGGMRAFPLNAARGYRALIRHTRSTALVHARSYVAAGVARALRHSVGVPYLFDARGYWIDERSEAGGAIERPLVLRAARRAERALYEGASAMVGLTSLHEQDVRSGRFGGWSGGPTATIPTCADYDEFVLREDAPGLAPDEALRGRFVVALIGSINRSYRTREALELARLVLDRRADAVLLFATQQLDAAAVLVRDAGVDPSRVLLRSIPHEAMPLWVRHIDVAIQLLVEAPAKRGSMPTKLAEFFAAGVRPAHTGCNTEVARWVTHAGSGLVLDEVSPASLARAAHTIAAWQRDIGVLRRAREITAEHFSLAAGVTRYATMLSTLGIGARPCAG